MGLATAVGCIFYEKIVHNFSYMTFLFVLTVEVICLYAVSAIFFKNEVASDMAKLAAEPKYLWWMLAYVATGVTSILWYTITKDQNVMAGSVYEVKYIVMMAIIYVFFGQEKMTMNMWIGIALAMGSVYFISKK